MKATLIRFGQEVDIEHPEQAVHTLVFDVGGVPLSLPVPAETIKALVTALEHRRAGAVGTAQRPVEVPPPEVPEPRHTEADLGDASEFGGDVEEAGPAPRADQCPNCGYPDCFNGKSYKGIYTVGEACSNCGFFDGPESEEEVKSL